jgi:NADH-quinone oxidoreductase subunit C
MNAVTESAGLEPVPSSRLETLATVVAELGGEALTRLPAVAGELAFEVSAAALMRVCRQLRDDPRCAFDTLIDVSGIDYLTYGMDEWTTQSATSTGFGRGVARTAAPGAPDIAARRFAVSYQLLSVALNQRLRLRCYCDSGEPPLIDSVVEVWPGANWFEREAFDLYGILFKGHPDLRRILTDYGFIGHPFRKDFPLSGHVEVRYDPAKRRVVYEPVSIEPRVLVPRVIRGDHRYDPALTVAPTSAGKSHG